MPITVKTLDIVNGNLYNLRLCDSARDTYGAGFYLLVGAMKIVKGDLVYLRSGKDVAGLSRLPDDARNLPMAEQIAAANKEKGVRGQVLRTMPTKGKIVVEGLNMITKHQRPKSSTGAAAVQQGGRIAMEAAIPVSRVMLVCSHCDRPTRVGLKAREVQRETLGGSKTKVVFDRVCKHCGEIMERPTESLHNR